MGELIERFSYRFQLWRREQLGDQFGADPDAPRNPLRFVAYVAIFLLTLDALQIFTFYRAPDILLYFRLPVAIAFLILYRSKSP
jgi:hypothetical protein